MNNRLRDIQAFQIFTAVKLVIIISFITLLGLGFIVQHNTHRHLSEELSKCEKRLQELKEKNQIQEAYVARLRNPEALRQKVEEMGLNLVEISQEQIVRLYQNLSLFKTPPVKVAQAQ